MDIGQRSMGVRGEGVKQLELAQISKELYDSVQSLGRGRKILFDYAKKLAQAEKDYRQALSKEIMKLKGEGIQVSIISDLARGNTASQRYDRDLAETMWKAAIKNLEALQSEQTALQSILKWQNEVPR